MLECRIAKLDDSPALDVLMTRAIAELQRGFLDEAQIAASKLLMGLDTQLIRDGSYFAVWEADAVVGCGGWSLRATPYGGDHSAGRDESLLDPARERARVRAMYTDPAHVRRGVGRMILAACEAAARAEGFSGAELTATLAGEPLYLACGYREYERFLDHRGPVPVPLVRMAKPL